MRRLAQTAAVTFLFVVPVENAVVLPGIGTIGRLAGVLAAGAWVLAMLTAGSIKRTTAAHLPIILFLLWGITSVIWSEDPTATQTRALTFFQSGVLMLLLWDVFRTQSSLMAGLQAYVLGAFVSITMIFWSFATQNPAWNSRFSAPGFNPNDIGFLLALGLPIAWYLATANFWARRIERKLAILNFAYIPAAMFAILLTGSRGSLAATLPMLAYAAFTLGDLPKVRRRWVMFAMTIAFGIGISQVPGQSLERLGTTVDSLTAGDLNQRGKIWSKGIGAIPDRPVLGSGSAAFKRAAGSDHVAHNALLSIWVELGSVGLVLFLVVLVKLFHLAWIHPPKMAKLWLAVLCTWLLGAFVHTWEHEKSTWLFFSAVVASASMQTAGQGTGELRRKGSKSSTAGEKRELTLNAS